MTTYDRYQKLETAEGLRRFASELREAMETTPGGASRFGALAEVRLRIVCMMTISRM